MRDRLVRTRGAVAAALDRRDGRAALLLGTLTYPLLYLASLGHLSLGGEATTVRTVADPLVRARRTMRPFVFEPIARVTVPPVDLLFSPLNLGVGVALGVLVGLNLALTLVAWRSPATCGVDRATGVFAGVPALLSGATCCGPGLLFVLGVQTTGAVAAALGYATPVALALLVGSLVVIGGRVDAPVVDTPATRD